MKRTVVVTGSASGIGKATASMLEALDWRVIGVDRRHADVVADLATADGREHMLEDVDALSNGRLDAVVACAGIWQDAPIAVAVNYFGALATLDGLLPALANGDQPRAVLVSSFACINDVDNDVLAACLRGDEADALAAAAQSERAYASSKAAITRWARRQSTTPEWAGAGILLNIVCPGLIVTPMTKSLIADAAALGEFHDRMPMPIGRHGRPEDVARVIAFLVSPESSYMVGQILFVDGGAEATLRDASR